MNQTVGYSQFIYGKLVDRNSGYGLIARTADLTNENQLIDMVERTHNFWSQPPSGNKSKGVGVFCEADRIIFAQFSRALNERDEEVASGGSPFYQHRYIFIPPQSLDLSHHQTPLILSWLIRQRIPLFREFNNDLSPFQLPSLESPVSASPEQSSKIQYWWNETNSEGESLLLSALAILINRHRLLLARDPDTKIIPEVFLESVLLLLPAVCRSQVAIAVGSLEEDYCTWAQLIVRNGLPGRRSLDDGSKALIWLDLANRRFEGEFQPQVLKHPYVDDTLLPLAKTVDRIDYRIRQLNQISDQNLSLETLDQPEFIVNFIPELSADKQTEVWKKYIPRISSELWNSLTVKIESQPSLMSLWSALEYLSISDPTQKLTAPLLLVWRKLDSSEQIKLLENNLRSEIAIAEELLLSGFLELSEHQSTEVAEELRSLCQFVVVNKANRRVDAALELVDSFTKASIFQDPDESFKLLDAIFSRQIEPKVLFGINVLKRFSCIQPSQWTGSHLSQAIKAVSTNRASYLEQLIQRQPNTLNYLADLLEELEIAPLNQDQIFRSFLEAWALSFAPTKYFLKSLLEKSIKDSKFTPDHFPESYDWFAKQNPGLELNQVFYNLKRCPDDWENWVQTARLVCETPVTEIKFLDQTIGQRFIVELLQQWLLHNSSGCQAKVNWLSPTTWAALQPESVRRILALQHQSAGTLIQALVLSGRYDLIQGDLIHYLAQDWIAHREVSPSLVTVLSSPILVQHLSIKDRLALQRASWQAKVNLGLSKPLSSHEDKQQLYDTAIESINRTIKFEDGLTLLRDCHSWGLDMKYKKRIAIELIKRCEQATQVRQLLEVCFDIDFDLFVRQEVLCQARPESCEIGLILSYLGDRQDIDLARDKALLRLLLTIPVQTDSEREDFKNFSTQLFMTQIANHHSPADLQWWRAQSIDQKLYEETFTKAIEQLVPTLDSLSSLPQLCQYAQKLRSISMSKESDIIHDLVTQKVSVFFSN